MDDFTDLIDRCIISVEDHLIWFEHFTQLFIIGKAAILFPHTPHGFRILSAAALLEPLFAWGFIGLLLGDVHKFVFYRPMLVWQAAATNFSPAAISQTRTAPITFIFKDDIQGHSSDQTASPFYFDEIFS